MRRLLALGVLVACVATVLVVGTGASSDDGGDYRVRAVFDNAFSLIEGEDVRISGVNVGKISALDVTPDNRAAVVMDITRPGFQDFREDATCTIRPQGLIGERFIECTLTQPRPAGRAAPPALREIPDGEPGAGQRLLGVERTTKPVDIDLLNNITRLPQRQRLAIILNEFGAGVAGRADDLNETIRRANPALGATNDVLEILGDQNEVLRRLAADSDTVLAPLARDRQSLASFIEQANDVSQATAERRADLERNFELLPRFLRELRPTMARLEGFADEFEPVLSDLGSAAPDINRLVRELGPFSQASIPAFQTLGEAADVGRPALVRAKPIIDDLRTLSTTARPLAENLRALTTSLRDTGGIERLMDFFYFGTSAINGYDRLGHYLRAGLIVNTCSGYSATPQPGCSARWASEDSEAEQASAASATNTAKAFAARAARAEQNTAADPQDAAQAAPAGAEPGAATTTASNADPAGMTPAQEGMLDFLLGGGR